MRRLPLSTEVTEMRREDAKVFGWLGTACIGLTFVASWLHDAPGQLASFMLAAVCFTVYITLNALEY